MIRENAPCWKTVLKILGGTAIIVGAVVGSVLTAGTLSVVLAGAALGAIGGAIGAAVGTAVSNGDIDDFANSFLIGTKRVS